MKSFLRKFTLLLTPETGTDTDTNTHTRIPKYTHTQHTHTHTHQLNFIIRIYFGGGRCAGKMTKERERGNQSQYTKENPLNRIIIKLLKNPGRDIRSLATYLCIRRH